MRDFLLNVDMDGVIADFEKGYTEHTKIPFHIAKKLPDELFWGNIATFPNFFYHLPLMDDAYELWNAIKFLDPRVLTAIPRVSTFPEAGPDKKRYIANYFGDHVIVNLSMGAHNKIKYYRKGTKDILIDDRQDTIDTWNKAGGIGIFHTSAANTLSQLRSHGII